MGSSAAMLERLDVGTGEHHQQKVLDIDVERLVSELTRQYGQPHRLSAQSMLFVQATVTAVGARTVEVDGEQAIVGGVWSFSVMLHFLRPRNQWDP